MAKAKSGARARTTAAAYPAPQTMTAANECLTRIGALQRERARIVTAMNDEIAGIKERFSTAVTDTDAELRDRIDGLQAFCESRRAELTGEGKVKFHRFPAGEISWRQRPPSVRVRGREMVIAAIKALGLSQFLRVQEEVNREAMLAEPDKAAAIDGVTIGSAGEDFVIRPFETELEEVVT